MILDHDESYLHLIEEALVLESGSCFVCYVVVPATENTTDIVKSMGSTPLDIIHFVGMRYTEISTTYIIRNVS